MQVSFAYASPVVTGLSCSPNGTLASTTGGSICTVFGNNLALPDIATGQGSGLAVLFGNPSDLSVYTQAIRASLVPRPDSDLTTVTPYLPGRVQFAVPAGMGVGRAVRLVSFRSGDPFPTPSSYTTSPLPITEACSYSSAAPLGCLGGVDVFSYAAPALDGVVVTLPSTAEQISLATSQFGQNAVVSGSVRVITLSGACMIRAFLNPPLVHATSVFIAGANFGASTASAGSPLVTRTVQWLDTSVGGGVWRDFGYFVFTSAMWTDAQIVTVTRQTTATIRVVVTSADWAGNTQTQVSNSVTYSNLSPSLLVGSTGPYPTTALSGGLPILLSITATNLGSGTGVNVSVGGSPCPLVNPSNPSVLLDPSLEAALIINNPAVYSPSSQPIGAATVWSFQCRLPSGQGASVPVAITREPDGAGSGSVSISYFPPTVTGISTSAGTPVAPINPRLRYAVDPGGTS